MAIAKIIQGKGFSGVIKYAAEKEDAQLIGTNCANQDSHGIAFEMRVVAASNTRCKNPVIHASISAPPGERYSDEQWSKVAEVWRREMSIPADNQFAIYRHNDRDHDHIHIVCNRVGMNGKAVDLKNSYERSHKALRVAEKEAVISVYSNTRETETTAPVNESIKSRLNKSIDENRGKGFGELYKSMKDQGLAIKSEKAGGYVIRSDDGVMRLNKEQGQQLRQAVAKPTYTQMTRSQASQSGDGGDLKQAGQAIAQEIKKGVAQAQRTGRGGGSSKGVEKMADQAVKTTAKIIKKAITKGLEM